MYIIFFRDNTSTYYNLNGDEQDSHKANFKNWVSLIKAEGMLKLYSSVDDDGAVVSGLDQSVSWNGYEDNSDRITAIAILDINNQSRIVELLKSCPVFTVNGSAEVKKLTDL